MCVIRCAFLGLISHHVLVGRVRRSWHSDWYSVRRCVQVKEGCRVAVAVRILFLIICCDKRINDLRGLCEKEPLEGQKGQ